MKLSISIREKDQPDIERIKDLIKEKDRSLSGLVIQLLRRWEREVLR